jgi:hypothetical protein
MIDAIVREALGAHGRVILDFWLEHTLIISSIVLLYGVIVVCANNNFQNLIKKARELAGVEELAGQDPAVTLAEKDTNFWEILLKSSRFPFIASSFSLLLHRVTRVNAQKLLSSYFLTLQKIEAGRKRTKRRPGSSVKKI